MCNYFCKTTTLRTKPGRGWTLTWTVPGRQPILSFTLVGFLSAGSFTSSVLLPNLLASNCQREEVFAVLLLVADLDPRPLVNFGNRVAKYNIPGTGLVVIIAEMPSQDNLWRTDTYMNSCIAPNVNKKGNKNLPWGFQFEMLLWV